MRMQARMPNHTHTGMDARTHKHEARTRGEHKLTHWDNHTYSSSCYSCHHDSYISYNDSDTSQEITHTRRGINNISHTLSYA